MLDATDSYSISGFLQGEFTRVGAKTTDAVVDNLRDRHFGREIAWRPPVPHEDADVEDAVAEAVANKSSDATAAFAEGVAAAVHEGERVAYSEVDGRVGAVADAIEDDFGETFGATVRENAVEAAWTALTADVVTELFDLVDDATSDRKDDEVVRALAERIAAKFDGRHRATHDEVADYVRRAADMTVERDDATVGETARENVTEALWTRMRPVPDELPKVTDVANDRDAAADLLEAMRATEVMAPPTNCLAPIRAELIEEGLRKEVDADYYTAVTRDAEVHGGDPFVVEAGIAYGGELEEGDTAELMRFANRVPLVYQQGACAITDVARSIDWRNYGLDQPGGSGMPSGPAIILIHVASTNVPFTSESKDAVANIPAIEKEVELAVREAARGMKSHLNKRRSLEKRRKKQAVILDILPKMAKKVASVTGRPEPDVSTSLARIMNNVLVTRDVEDGRVELTVANNTDATADLEVTEIVSVEPSELSAGNLVDMDGEWFVRWEPSVAAGEEVTLSYALENGEDPAFDVDVQGIEEEKLTIDR
jgi:DNA topoisomerase-6 subunit B